MTIYKSENWIFDSSSQQLIYNDGDTKQLPSRLNQCLLTLISTAGQTVSYDELLSQVWGTVHKDSSTISSVISELRKLVGCGQNGKKLIVTVPKRGYRFSQTVELVNHNPIAQIAQGDRANPEFSSDQDSDVSPNSSSPSTRSKIGFEAKGQWLLAMVVFVAVILLFYLPMMLSKKMPTNAALGNVMSEYEVLSHETGSENEFDVSKDGIWLTYVNRAPNKTASLLVKHLASGRKQTILASDDYYFGSPVFSRDGKYIVFHKQTATQCEVWLADFSQFELDAEKTKKLTNCGKGGFWSTNAFTKDGQHIFFSRANSLTDPYTVFRLDLRTLFERSITAPTSSGRGDYSFSLSPNGEQLAVVRNVLWQQSHILLSDSAGEQSRTAFVLPYLIARVGWLSDDELVFCDKEQQLWSYHLVEEQQKPLTRVDFSCHHPVVADGGLYALKPVKTNNAIWALSRGTDNEFSIQPIISSPYYDHNAMFGENNSLYFLSNRSGEEKLWQKTRDGFVQHKNINLPKYARELSFSVATNTLYGLSEKRLFRYDLNLNVFEWLSKEEHEVFNFSISDDDQLIFSEGKNEYWELKSLDLMTLKLTALNINGFSVRQLKQHLYFTKFHQKGLWKRDMKTGVTEKISEDIAIKFNNFWDIWDNNTLIWATDNTFKMFDLNTGELLSDTLTYDGHVNVLKCSHTHSICTFSHREGGETEIVKLNGKF